MAKRHRFCIAKPATNPEKRTAFETKAMVINMKNKKDRKKSNKKEGLDPAKKKTYIIAATVIAAVMIIVSVSAVVIPFARINSGFDDIFDAAEDMDSPMVILTDMLADNVLSGESVEIMLDDPVKTKALVERLDDAADDMKYRGKSTKAHSSWDIRVMIREGSVTLTVYMAPDRMYYSSGAAKYFFVPEDGDELEGYKKLFEEVRAMIKAGQ